MPLKRANWWVYLHQYLSDCESKAFAWGSFDCVIFAVGCLEAMLGRPVETPDFDYTDKAGAILKAQDIQLSQEMKRQLQAYDVEPGFIQQGDVVIIQEDGLEKAMVFTGSTLVVPMPEKTGLFKCRLKALNGQQLTILRFH